VALLEALEDEAVAEAVAVARVGIRVLVVTAVSAVLDTQSW